MRAAFWTRASRFWNWLGERALDLSDRCLARARAASRCRRYYPYDE